MRVAGDRLPALGVVTKRFPQQKTGMRAYCQGTNGCDLASIPDLETNELVLSLISGSGMYWLGGTDAATEGGKA